MIRPGFIAQGLALLHGGWVAGADLDAALDQASRALRRSRLGEPGLPAGSAAGSATTGSAWASRGHDPASRRSALATAAYRRGRGPRVARRTARAAAGRSRPEACGDPDRAMREAARAGRIMGGMGRDLRSLKPPPCPDRPSRPSPSMFNGGGPNNSAQPISASSNRRSNSPRLKPRFSPVAWISTIWRRSGRSWNWAWRWSFPHSRGPAPAGPGICRTRTAAT